MKFILKKYSETIMQGAKEWMVKNGATAVEEGIGWRIF